VKTPEFADYLAVALANIELGNWSQGEAILDNATRSNWASPRKYELQILYRLLLEIRRNGGFELFDEDYVEGLGRQFEDSVAASPVPNVRSFCPG
jgi:hypothetical protein